jgi:hypothetical protein
MRKIRIVTILLALVAALGITASPASAKPYNFHAVTTAVSVR